MRAYCVALTKPWPADGQREQFVEDLAGKLVARGVHTLLIPDIYQIRPHSEAFSILRRLDQPLIVGSWLKPRAAFWTLRVMGVGGPPPEAPKGTPQPELVCVDLSERSCPGKWVEDLQQRFGGGFPGGTGKLIRAKGTSADRWYPVIDQERCQNCHECAEFCLFGVYEKTTDGNIRVANPDACKPGCPACSRVCPAQAIMFPLCDEDDAIAGAENAVIKPFDPATLAQIQKHRAKEKARQKREEPPVLVRGKGAAQALAAGCNCSKEAPADQKRSGSPARQKHDDAYFDDVIGGLVKE